jgi:methyl-galactoside transport system substrate-binding protein
MFKRIAMLLMCCVVTIMAATTVIACGAKDPDVEVFLYSVGDQYINAMVRPPLERELKAANMDYQLHDGANNAQTQRGQITAALNRGTKLLLVNPVEPNDTNAILTEATAAGAQVLFFNKQDPNFDYAGRSSMYVGSDLDGGGAMQGDMAAKALLPGGAYDMAAQGVNRTVKAMVLFGQVDHPDATYRTLTWIKAARAALTAAGSDINIDFGNDTTNNQGYVFTMASGQDWSTAGATTVVTTENTARAFVRPGRPNPNNEAFNIVLANNDDMAIGAANVLNPTSVTAANRIPIFGIDASAPARTLVSNGRMAGTVEQQAERMSVAIVAIARRVLQDGQTFSQARAATDFGGATYQDKNLDVGIASLNYTANAAVVRIPYKPFTA